jgi:hypothetical protein
VTAITLRERLLFLVERNASWAQLSGKIAKGLNDIRAVRNVNDALCNAMINK